MLQTNDLYTELFSIFIQKLGSKLELKPQNQKLASYYSRLYTEINGAIDWNWSVTQIENFIRAFSKPYPGAFTFFKEYKLYIWKAKILEQVKNAPIISAGGFLVMSNNIIV